MTWLDVVGLLSTASLLLPIVLTLAMRLAWYKSFPALIGYYLLVSTYGLLSSEFVGAGKNFLYYYGVFNNFLDTPLMLTFMTYFSKTAAFRNKMKLIIPVFLAFELVIIAIYGFNIQSAIIVLGPGLLTVLLFSILFFIHQAKITVIHQKAIGKALISAALLFMYGGYTFIYIVYYLIRTPYKADALLIYFLITIFSSILLAAGIFFERRRVRQLSELQVTREELRVIYGGKTAAS